MKVLAVLVIVLVLATGCGGTNVAQPSSTPTTLPTTTPDAPATATAQAAVAATSQVQASVTAQAAASATAQAVASITAQAQGTARAQQTAATAATAQALSAYLEALAQSAKKAYGPADGTLELKGNLTVPGVFTGVTIRNFVAEIRFFNPSDRAVHPWDYGLAFRRTDRPLRNAEYRLRVRSDETWTLVVSTGERNPDQTLKVTTVTRGSLKNLDTSPTGSNQLRVIVQDKAGYFFVNGDMISALDLSERNVEGDIWIGTGFGIDAQFPGLATRYKDFVVSSLP